MGCFAEKRGFISVELLCEFEVGWTQDFPEIFMDRGVVVDNQDAVVLGGQRRNSGAHESATKDDALGSSRVNVAPHPVPALATESAPPIARAASAPLCNPNP